jgi:flagellar hook assembly protein FlgD
VQITVIEKPTVFALEQNYPNPFNPATTISYKVPEASHVRLVIYNVLGEAMRTLADADQGQGVYSIVWDGRNDQGLSVSSGIYYSVFTAVPAKHQGGKYRSVKSMMLVK